MQPTILATTCLAALLAGCFPDPPALDATDTGAVDARDGEEAEDGDVAGPNDGEVAPDVVDTREPDTLGDADTRPVDATDVAETDAADDVGSDVAAEADGVAPECDDDEDCTRLDAVCVEGTCDAGTCVATELTGTTCDDGLRCTEGDTCDAGTCKGTAVVCTALSQCHDPGECDASTGFCSNPVRPPDSECDDALACTTDDVCNDGVCAGAAVVCAPLDQCHDAGVCDTTTGNCSNPASSSDTECDDGLKCTASDTCNAGLCEGIAVVCVASDQCHDAGECDTTTGACSNPSKPDTTECDDTLKCTENDTCTGGVCAGTAIVCEALDECHKVGVCDPGTGACTNPLQANGGLCDDEDFCTAHDVCTNGFCFGPDSPPFEDFVVGFESDGKFELTGLSSRSNGEAIVAFSFLGSHLDLVGASTFNIVQATGAEVYCRTYLSRFRKDGSLAAATLFAEPTCNSYARVSIGRIHSPGDNTSIVLGGFANSPFVTALGVHIGDSPNGLTLKDGHFLARVKDDGAVMWHLDFLGFGESYDSIGLPSMAFNASNEGAVSVNVGMTIEPRQVVDKSGSVALEETFARNEASLIYVVGPAGDIRRTLRIESPEGVFVRSTLYTNDGTIIVAGATIGGDTTIKAGSESVVIPSAIHTEASGWVAAIDSTGKLLWWRHFFVPPFAQATSEDLTVFPLASQQANGRLWVAFDSQRHMSSRNDTGSGALVSGPTGAHPGRLTLVELSILTGAVLNASPLGTMETYAPTLVADALGIVLPGRTRQLLVDGDLVASADSLRPFLARPGAWAVKIAHTDNESDPGAFLNPNSLYYEPFAAVDQSGGFYVAGNLKASAEVGYRSVRGVTTRGTGTSGYLTRVASNHYLDCR